MFSGSGNTERLGRTLSDVLLCRLMAAIFDFQHIQVGRIELYLNDYAGETGDES